MRMSAGIVLRSLFLLPFFSLFLSTGLATEPLDDLLRKAKAHWVTPDAVVWRPVVSGDVYLIAAPEGELTVADGRVAGPTSVRLEADGIWKEGRLPHLAGMPRFRIPKMTPKLALSLLKGPLALVVLGKDGKAADATTLQTAAVIDDLAVYDGNDLGARPAKGGVEFRLWAPTARAVKLKIFSTAEASEPETEVELSPRPRGVWFGKGPRTWVGKYYLYEVSVHARETGRLERNLVTDPYSFSLAADSRRSQVVDPSDPSLAPEGWKRFAKPPLASFEDAAIYELHVRDFSISDESVKPDRRGKFLAFADADGRGMRHLAALAKAGLTHVHLLPAFDFASVPERDRKEPDIPKSGLASDSEIPQDRIAAVASRDGFNWGYDPFHFLAPEGSYASEPSGVARVREFREMVASLNGIGLRVVMDVVFNHTHAAGQAGTSVLDRIVPGYYHRLNENGDVETSTCCSNTATEHRMMEKLMVDALLHWARIYKVDGFRFDLMGHHTLENMKRIRRTLDNLTLANDGVDGRSIFLYGEGWDFGEVAKNRLFRNASQLNLAGTGIGSFSDRIRDALRGGSPFTDPREQGFVTGLSVFPSDYQAKDSPEAQKGRLAELSLLLEASLAGNLRGFEVTDAKGKRVRAETLSYNGQPAAYASKPSETVNYVSAHDNETLFDALQWKLPLAASAEQRVRVNTLALAFVTLAQGVPFFHAGDELLRSKSLDRNSFDSGDWFNRLDFSLESNNWGVGLPPRGENGKQWELMRSHLSNRALAVAETDIGAARDRFLDLLRVRKSSPLFRLRSEADVKARLSFLNAGPGRIPGLVVMDLRDVPKERRDPQFGRVVTLFNANPKVQTFSHPSLTGRRLELHPILASGSDSVVKTTRFDGASGTFEVPAFTAAVFVERD